MNKRITLLFTFLAGALAATEPEQPENEPNEVCESEESQETSTIEEVIEVLTEAAISDRDFGKDISDR